MGLRGLRCHEYLGTAHVQNAAPTLPSGRNDLRLSDTRPPVAMQVTNEVNWGETDFAVFAAMLAVAAGSTGSQPGSPGAERRRFFEQAFFFRPRQGPPE